MDQGTSPKSGSQTSGFYQGVTDQLVRYARGFAKWDLTYNVHERVKGKGDYLSARQYYTAGGQAHKIPDYCPEKIHEPIVNAFWELKCGDIDYRIRHDDLRHVLLNRNERSIILKMDRAFLSTVAEERQKAARKK